MYILWKIKIHNFVHFYFPFFVHSYFIINKEFMYKTPQSYEEKIMYLQAENDYLKELLGLTAEKVKKKKNMKPYEN